MVMADGARADIFEALLAAGELPNIEHHIVARGSSRRAASVFASTTGPAHVPFVTGLWPGSADIPGIRWFDRRRYRPGIGGVALAMRSYCGAQARLIDRDLTPAARTLFELCDNPLSVFGFVTRGVHGRSRIGATRKLWLWPQSRRSGHYDQADAWAMRAVERIARRDSELIFVMFAGIDGHSHHAGPDDERALASYRTVDDSVGRIAAALKRRGTYDDTMLVICSDHGHALVHTHLDIAIHLERHHQLRVAYHMGKTLTRRPEAVACVSGNGMAHLYFRAGDWARTPTRDDIERCHPGMLAQLLGEPAIEIVVSRGGGGALIVESRRGRAELSETATGVRYRPLGPDPFGFGPLPAEMTFEEALGITFESEYPDALVQIAQLARSPRCGDVLLSASPGFDLRERYESREHRSGHGALQRLHMQVPLAVSVPLAEGPMRTADVYPTVLRFLGRDCPAGVDGVDRSRASRTSGEGPADSDRNGHSGGPR